MVDNLLFGPGARCGGKYDIVRLLARRAVTESYLAVHAKTGVKVVVTCSRFEHIEGDAPSQDAFTESVTKRGMLSMEGLPNIHGFGIDEGVYWLAEDYIDAPLLFDATRERYAETGSREWLALDSMAALLSAANILDYAADEGVLHGDLTPDCLFIVGLPRIFGTFLFGLGHAQIFLLDSRSRRRDPRYQSPEALAGGAVDERSDIYSLGMILHTLIAQQPPFAERDLQDEASLLALAQSAMPRPLEELGFCPPVVSSFITTAIAKDPGERYPSWSELMTRFRSTIMLAIAHPRMVEVMEKSTLRLQEASGDAPAARPARRAVGSSGGPITVPPGPETRRKVALATTRLRASASAPTSLAPASLPRRPDAPKVAPRPNERPQPDGGPQPDERPQTEPCSRTPRSPLPWTPAPLAQERPLLHTASTEEEADPTAINPAAIDTPTIDTPTIDTPTIDTLAIDTPRVEPIPTRSPERDEVEPVTLPSIALKRVEAPAAVAPAEHRKHAPGAALETTLPVPFARSRVVPSVGRRLAFALAALLTTGLLAFAVVPGSRRETRALARGAHVTFDLLPPLPLHPAPEEPPLPKEGAVSSNSIGIRRAPLPLPPPKAAPIAPSAPAPSATAAVQPASAKATSTDPFCETRVYCFQRPQSRP